MTFPVNPVLDNFNRANEGPPPSANWNTVLADDGGLKVSSNQCIPAAYVDGKWYGAYWSADTFGPNCEAYFTLPHFPTVIDGREIILSFDVVDPEVFAESYSLIVTQYFDVFNVNFRKNSGGVTTFFVSNITAAEGDKFYISMFCGTVTLQQFTSGVWSTLYSGTDASPLSNPGYIVVEIRTNASDGFFFDDFGGGDLGSCAAAPVANFSGTPLSGSAPLSVTFTDSSTNTPTSWSWTFGDGNTSTDQNPTNVYSTPGTYTVALTATNGLGSDTETKTDYITVLGAPVADFSGTPTSGTVSLSVAFTDLSTNSPDTWYWFFGDGGTAATQNPTHVYTLVGVYTVALTASSSAGSDSEMKIAYITVTDTAEVGPAEVDNCDINTGGLATGLRVADVAIARDNNLGSLVIDASAELRVKDNAYGTLTNNGTLTSLAGDRSVWDTTNFAARHARDIDEATGQYHLVNAATQTYTISNPSTDRSYDVTGLTLNELAAVVGTLIADLQAKGLLS